MKLLCFLLAAACAWAQRPCAVRGVVTDSTTGKPLASARVFLAPRSSKPAPSLMQASGEQGAFCFAQAEPGNYVLQTQRSGYLDRIYGEGMILAVGTGTELPELNVKMIRRAILSGSLVDEAGDAVAGATVTVYRRVKSGAGFEPDEVDSLEADDRGFFRFGSLPPGTYFLGAKDRNDGNREYRVPFLDAGGRANQDAPVEVFYSAASAFDGAKPIVLEAGKDISGLLLTIRKTQLRHISGTVVGSADTVWFERSDGGGTGARVSADGSFFRGGLEPGVYTVMARTGNLVRGRKEVDLTGGDADGVVVPLDNAPDPRFTVLLQFRTESGSPPFRPPARSFAILQESGSGNGSIAQQTADGFQFNAVFPAVYSVGLWGEEDYYIKRIFLGGHEVEGRKLDLRHGNQGVLVLSMAKKSASVEGSVVHEGVLSQAVTVLLRSDRWTERTVTDQNGHFRLERLAPGKYRLFALEGLDANEWNDAVAAALQPKSVEVELTDGEKRELTAPVIHLAEIAAAVAGAAK